jgi:hypothetical protein
MHKDIASEKLQKERFVIILHKIKAMRR